MRKNHQSILGQQIRQSGGTGLNITHFAPREEARFTAALERYKNATTPQPVKTPSGEMGYSVQELSVEEAQQIKSDIERYQNFIGKAKGMYDKGDFDAVNADIETLKTAADDYIKALQGVELSVDKARKEKVFREKEYEETVDEDSFIDRLLTGGNEQGIEVAKKFRDENQDEYYYTLAARLYYTPAEENKKAKRLLQDSDAFDVMEPSEKDLFYKIYKVYGKSEAEDFLRYVDERFGNARTAAAEMEEAAKWAKENPEAASLKVPLGQVVSVIGLYEPIRWLFTGEPIDEYSPAFKFSRKAAAASAVVKEHYDKNLFEGAGWIWENVINTTLQFGLTMGAAKILSLPATAAVKAGSAASQKIVSDITLGLMGSQASANALLDAKQRGLSDSEAISYAFIIGGIEAATEKIGIDALFGNPKSVFTKIFKNSFLRAGMAEGTEEVVANWGNRLTELFYYADEAQLRALYQSFRDKGLDENEALAETIWSLVKEDAETFVAGMGSGMLINSGFAAVSKAQEVMSANKVGTQIIKNGQENALIDTALKLNGNTKAHQLASQISNEGVRNKAQMGKLAMETELELGKQQAAAYNNTIYRRAMELSSDTKVAKTIADNFTALVFGNSEQYVFKTTDSVEVKNFAAQIAEEIQSGVEWTDELAKSHDYFSQQRAIVEQAVSNKDTSNKAEQIQKPENILATPEGDETVDERELGFTEPNEKEIRRPLTYEEQIDEISGRKKTVQMRHILDLAKKLDSKLKVVFVPNNDGRLSGQKGMFDGDSNTMYLANDISTIEGYAEVFKHEFVHRLELKKAYDGLKRYLFNKSVAFEDYAISRLKSHDGKIRDNRQDAIDDLIKMYIDNFKNKKAIPQRIRDNFTREKAEREAVADFIARTLFKGNTAQLRVALKTDMAALQAVETDLKLFEELARDDRKLFKKIIDAIKDFIASIKGIPQFKTLEQDLAYIEQRLSRVYNSRDIKNTATDSGVVYYTLSIKQARDLDVDWDSDNHSSLKTQLRNHLDKVNAMEPVATVVYNKQSKKPYYQVLEELLRTKFGNKIERQGYGTITFGESTVDDSRNYVNTDAEAAALIAAPYVLKRGKVISGHKNHKEKGNVSITFAAPVILNGERGNVVVAVLYGKGQVHSLRVLTPEGKNFELLKIKDIESTITGHKPKFVGKPYIETMSNDSITDTNENVNSSFSSDDLSTLDKSYMEAVNNGDMETAQKIVEEAANKGGYTQKLYHGTDQFGFTKFEGTEGFSYDEIQFFTTDSLETAGTYTTLNEVRRISGKQGAEIEQRITNTANDMASFMSSEMGSENYINSEAIIEASEKGWQEVSKLSNKWLRDLYESKYSEERKNRFQKRYKNFETFESSEKAIELKKAVTKYRQQLQLALENKTGGIYEFFANTDNMFVIDGKGAMWNQLKDSRLPENREYNTREVCLWAKEKGYSGVQFKNIIDSGVKQSIAPANVFAFFNPREQVKSADPVTYDDKGNVIPLTERFNPKNEDLRYSSDDLERKRDSDGNELSEGQQEFFKDSKLRDKIGRLLRLFHGTKNGGFTKFLSKYSDDGLTLFLTPTRELANTYSGVNENVKLPEGKKGLARLFEKGTKKGNGQAGIYEVYANAKNPYVIECDGANWDAIPFTEKIKGYANVNANFKYNEQSNTLTSSVTIDGTTYEKVLDFNHLNERIKNELESRKNKHQYANYRSELIYLAEQEIGDYYNTIANEELAERLTNISTDAIFAGEQSFMGAVNTKNGEVSRFDTRYVGEWAKKNGYDAVVFKNIQDSAVATDEKIIGDVVIVYDGAQIKAVDNRNPTKNKDIRYSSDDLTATHRDLLDRYEKGEISKEEYLAEMDSIYGQAVEQYGAIEKGEYNETDMPVPQAVAEDKPTKRFARTFVGAAKLTPEMVNEFEKDVLLGKFTYKMVSDESAMKVAESTVKSNEGEKSWENLLEAGGFPTKNDIAIGEKLLTDAIAKGDTYNTLKYASELADIFTRAGQAVQAASMLGKMTGAGRLVGAQRFIDSVNKDRQKKYGANVRKIKIDPKLAELLATAEGRRAIEQAYGEIMKDAAAQVEPTFLDKWNTWRYFAMLCNPRTHVRNIIGNAIFLPAVRMKDVIGTGIERMFHVDGTKVVKVKKEYRDFAKRDVQTAAAKNFLKGQKYDDKTTFEQNRRTYKSDFLESLTRGVFNALEVEDMFAKNKHYVHALGSYLQAKKIDLNNVSDEVLTKAREYAKNEAFKATFNDFNSIANKVSKLSKDHKVLGAFIEGVLPFKRTPLNIIRRSVEYSPIGLATSLTKGLYDLKKGKITADQLIDGVASGATGLIVFAIGCLFGSLGWAGGTDDDEDKSWYERMLGGQDYAIKIGNHSYTVDWAAPSSIPFFIGVELAEAFEDGFSLNALWDSFGNALEPIINLSALSGVQETIESVRNAQGNEILTSALTDAATNYLLQSIPSPLGALGRTIDEKQRTWYVDKNSNVPEGVQEFANSLKTKIPGLSYTMPEKIDAWGREVSRGGVGERIAENFVSPGYYSYKSYTDVEKEIEKLYDKTKEAKVLPKTAPKYFAVDGKRKDLTADEYVTFAKAKGQYSFEYVEEFINHSEYDKLTNEQKAEVISDLYEYAGAKAKTTVSKYDLMKTYKTVTLRERSGGSAVDYYIKNQKKK